MTTQYNIGDVIEIINYYDETCIADIVKITIYPKEIIYTLSNGEIVAEESKDNSWNRIIRKLGNK